MSTPSSVKITPSVELDLRIVTKTNPPILVTITGCQKRNYDSAFYYRGRLPESFRNLDLLCVKSFTNPNGSENPQDLDSSASADNVSIKRLKLFIPVKHFVKITKEAAEMVEELRKELTEVGDGFHLSAIRVLGHKERLLSKATRDSDITVEYSHDYDIPAKTFAWFVFTPELLDDLIIHLPSLEQLTINYNCPIELFENADVEDVTRRITIHLNNLCESDGQDLDISVGISANYSVIKFYYDYSGNSNKYVQ